jgi:hypothetical protein
MATSIPRFYSINGVIDTSRSVLENMNLICEASGCWMTFDIHEGKWAVVINGTGTPVASFNDDNIIGGVNITSTSLTELYNSVTYEFPHRDLRSERDSVTMKIPDNQKYPNEPNNILTLSSELINNQAQAQSLAAIQLKQSRIDKVISFTTDYSYVGLKAGDLIAVSVKSYVQPGYFAPNNYYNYTDAVGYYGLTISVFRITSIVEQDNDDGTLTMNITALEYNNDVYSTSGLEITERNRDTGIQPKSLNTELRNIDNQSSLKMAAGTGLALSFNAATGKYDLSSTYIPEPVIDTKLTLDATALGAGFGLAFDAITKTYKLSVAAPLTAITATSAIIIWDYPDGVDLDIRCRVKIPDVGQNTLDNYLGYTDHSHLDGNPDPDTTQWPASGTPYITWGGDNTGPGTELIETISGSSMITGTYYQIASVGDSDFTSVGAAENKIGTPFTSTGATSGTGTVKTIAAESVYVNISQLRSAFPTQRYFVIECRGNWYNAKGSKAVKINSYLYEGGTINKVGFGFRNTGFTKSRFIQGLSVFVDSFGQDGTEPGDLLGYMVIDTTSNTVQFRNELSGIA